MGRELERINQLPLMRAATFRVLLLVLLHVHPIGYSFQVFPFQVQPSKLPRLTKQPLVNKQALSRMALKKPQALPSEAECFVSLVSYPVQDHAPERMLRWKVRETSAAKDDTTPDAAASCFHFFDDNRRIEILESGVYRLQLYLEPVDSDVSKYFLEVNGSPVSSHAANSNVMRCYVSSKSVEATDARAANGKSPAAAHIYPMPDREDVSLKMLNVFEMRLNKWDMLLVRRKSNWIGKYGGRTAFGRLMLQAL